MYHHLLKRTKKIKVIGLPYASGSQQSLTGVEQTPIWLQNQYWFQRMKASDDQQQNIVYEQLPLVETDSNQPDSKSNSHLEALALSTHLAIKDGYYPIILGGSKSHTLGSMVAAKTIFPWLKIMKIDPCHDTKIPDVESMTYLDQRYINIQNKSPMLSIDGNNEQMNKDLYCIGVHPSKVEHLKRQSVSLVLGADECQSRLIDGIEEQINKDCLSQKKKEQHFWISFNAKTLDSACFSSKAKDGQLQQDDEGSLSLEFSMAFLERFTQRSLGIDISEVDFGQTANQFQRKMDEQTFRELFELICHQVNQPSRDDDFFYQPRILKPHKDDDSEETSSLQSPEDELYSMNQMLNGGAAGGQQLHHQKININLSRGFSKVNKNATAPKNDSQAG